MKIIHLLLFLPLLAFGWNDNQNASIRSRAMGGSGVCLTDAFSLSTNQAGITFVKSPFVATSFDTRFIASGINNKAFMAGMPVKNLGSFGLQFNSYGVKNYSENKIGLAYARSFGDRISMGLQLNYLNTVIGDIYGKSGTVSAELGVLAGITKELTLGAHLFNPTKAKIASQTSEYAPTIIRIGFLYRFNPKLIVTGEIDKSSAATKPSARAGVEYNVIGGLFLRTGVSSNPIQNTFGIGYAVGGFKADIYAGFNSKIGYSSGVGLSYLIKSAVKQENVPTVEQ